MLSVYNDVTRGKGRHWFSQPDKRVLSGGDAIVPTDLKMQFLPTADKLFGPSMKYTALLLLWHFTITFVSNNFFKHSLYIEVSDNVAVIWTAFVGAIFLSLAPFASFVADVKFGRFKTLVSSSYVIITSNIILIVGMCGLLFAVRNFNYLYYIFTVLIYAGILVNLSGMVFFLCNIIPFGTDQLQDAPTRHSVLFIYAIYLFDSIGSLINHCISLSGKNIRIDQYYNYIYVDKLKSSLLVTASCCFTAVSVLVVFIVQKKKHLSLTEHLGGNPYLLTWRVVKFAAQHNKPIRRSAFTFCESDYPSRLDFGKKRYGGPFTTEQVEDVKTLLNIIKVLLCLGPVFFLEHCTINRHYKNHQLLSSNIVKEQLLNGVLSTVLAVIFVPLIMKCFTGRYFPSMFKRIGFSIACLLLMFSIYILYNMLSTDDFINSGISSVDCHDNATAKSYENISSSTLSILLSENVIYFICRLFLNISVWEFICCQSPQCMKGLLFGLLYAIRAYNQLLANSTILIFNKFLHEGSDTCNSHFYMLNIGIAVLLLLIFPAVSYKYKYRKRDDICNIYQYAENYYSKFGTFN